MFKHCVIGKLSKFIRDVSVIKDSTIYVEFCVENKYEYNKLYKHLDDSHLYCIYFETEADINIKYKTFLKSYRIVKIERYE